MLPRRLNASVTASSHRSLRIGSSYSPFPLPTTRPLSTTRPLLSGGHDEHGSQYDPPGGWLWGIRPGEKYEKEGWENLFLYGFYGSIGLAVIAYAFKPDTTIQTWALEEARRRLEKEGILEDPEK